jgi:mRNA turnover protein 4
VVQVALGRSAADEHAEGLHLVSGRLVGQCMMLFTNRDRGQVEEYFSTFRGSDYARMGMLVTQDVWAREGPLEQFAHSQEPYLRSLGLPTRLSKSVVMLERDFRLCEKGQRLTAEQAKLLKAFGMQLAEASFALDCVWRQGRFEQVGAMELDDDDDNEEGGESGEEMQEEEEEEEEVQQKPQQKKGGKKQKFVFVRE